MPKIYTKVGDKGQTALLGGKKVPKEDARIEAYGTVDELNSVLGWARASLESEPSFKGLDADLEKIQNWLFDLGSLLAAENENRIKFKLVPLSEEQVTWMEKKIDEATAELPPLKQFILPSGSEASCRLHVARAVSRRAERCMTRLGDSLPENAIPFINRLSDYLFTMARWCNFKRGVIDVVWKSGSK